MPEMPPPTEEHEWLQKFVGDWESDIRVFMEPDAPPMEVKATESFRSIGGFWVIGEINGEMMDAPFVGAFTVGYDPAEEKYIGTWVDSMNSFLWEYEGSVDETGTILTMEAQGPCPMRPGLTTFRDVTEFKSDDHRVVTSSILGDDGEWITIMKGESRRKLP